MSLLLKAKLGPVDLFLVDQLHHHHHEQFIHSYNLISYSRIWIE